MEVGQREDDKLTLNMCMSIVALCSTKFAAFFSISQFLYTTCKEACCKCFFDSDRFM